MQHYVPLPIALLEIGQPLPVDVWSANGTLLLRKGQPVVSQDHCDKLLAHQASTTLNDAFAWQRSYERMVHALLHDGADVQTIAQARMPSEIRASDYVVGEPLSGGWLDVQAVLRGILYQGGLAIHPLERLDGLEHKALALLQADADDSLFCLFQALADDTLGYSASHALLCMVACTLTADTLGLSGPLRQSMQRAALTMNIGMAREQDSLARQTGAPTQWQRALIHSHAHKSVELLQNLGVDDADQLDIVRWHHDASAPAALPHTLECRRILALADAFIAKMAARKSRAPLSAVKAVGAMVLNAKGDALGASSAMAQAVGFYPPGSYVQLAHGDIAVVVQRGVRANAPWVISIVNPEGVAIARYQAVDTSQPAHAIAKAVNFKTVKVRVDGDKVRRARKAIAQ